MPPSFYVAKLNAQLLANGTESEVYVNTLSTLTGEAITFSIFSPFTSGYIVVDPEAQYGTQPEIIKFTSIDSSGVGFTGITRGLSAIGTSSVTANKVYHGVGTPVIISWGAQNINDLIAYVNTLVAGSSGNASITVAGITKLDKTVASLPRAKSTLVTQNGSSGAMTVKLNPFEYIYNGTTYGITTATATSAMVAPVTNPRIDLVVYSTSGSAIAVRAGTEGASPTAPTPTEGDIVFASIFHRTAETKILEQDDSTNGYIQYWYEPTVYSAKTAINSQQTTFGTDQSNTTTNATYTVGEANATTKHSIIGQSFVATVAGIQGVKLWKIADTGTFTGTVKVSLQAAGGLSLNQPSGSDLASYTISNAAWLKLNNAAEFAVAFSSEYESMTVGSSYWIVVTPSTGDNSNHPNLGYDSTSAHGQSLKYNNSTDGWVLTATAALYYKTTCGILSKVVQTDSTTGLVPTAVRPYSYLAFDKTAVNSSGTTEITVYSLQLEGGMFGTSTGLKYTLSFNARPVGSAVTIKLKLNGTTIVSHTVTQENNASVAAGSGTADFIIMNNGATNAQIWGGRSVWGNNATITAAALGLSWDNSTGTAAVDTTQPALFEVTFQISTTANTSWGYVWGLLEKIG